MERSEVASGLSHTESCQLAGDKSACYLANRAQVQAGEKAFTCLPREHDFALARGAAAHFHRELNPEQRHQLPYWLGLAPRPTTFAHLNELQPAEKPGQEAAGNQRPSPRQQTSMHSQLLLGKLTLQAEIIPRKKLLTCGF